MNTMSLQYIPSNNHCNLPILNDNDFNLFPLSAPKKCDTCSGSSTSQRYDPDASVAVNVGSTDVCDDDPFDLVFNVEFEEEDEAMTLRLKVLNKES